jgi:hypothetical protein
MTPRRIQCQRTRGWRKPEGAIYVGRPSRWGNPFRVGGHVATAAEAVARFRAETLPSWPPEQIAALRGRDLMCWCRLGEPCHADVLIEIANAAGASHDLR